ncbi:MAG: YolD-like family protein [Acholeplasmataceae bacterium]|nr:YolD-like family protein [Acholeplasmataceae bacterium]
MNNYVDRGIIKWAPFDGLAGFNDLYNDLKYQLGKKDKPLLSEEQLYYMDITLKEAVINNSEVMITYYKNGYLSTLFGYITKLDDLKRLIYLDAIPFKIDQIVSIELI